jgi:hypothetical protein
MEETVYFVFNSARHPTTRLLRTIAPGRASHVQRILGGTRRLVGHGFAKINRQQLDAYWEDLKLKCRTGQLVIRVGGPRGPIFGFDDPTIEKIEEQTSEVIEEEKVVATPEEPIEEVLEEASTSLTLTELIADEKTMDEMPSGEPIPDMKSSRDEIVKYVVKNLGKTEDELEGMTKRQILALVTP